MVYRLGLDIGANSIGWACLNLGPDGQPASLLDIGVRIYPDGRNPKDGSSLAVARRVPRSMRRRRDRYLARRRQLLAALIRFNLMADDEVEQKKIAASDPYTLRQAALHRRLEPFELGRALFHINQRRGFKSNRKLDRGNEEAGKVNEATARLKAEMTKANALTIGDWLATRHAQHEPVRVRLAGSGKTASYPFYPSRALLEDEFDTIWIAQSGWNPDLTDEMRKILRRIIFHQRPLKPVIPGKCWLEPAEDRAPKALPLAQRFRIAQTLAHLLVVEPGMPSRSLNEKDRRLLLAELDQSEKRSYAQIRKILKLSGETDFNFRDENIAGDITAFRLIGTEKRPCIGADWHKFNLATQNQIAEIILDSDNDEEGAHALMALGLSVEQAGRAIRVTLPDGRVALSAKAMAKILPFMETGIGYAEAVQKADYAHHSDRRTGEIRTTLPYYGELLAERIGTGTANAEDGIEKRYGRAPNPTVHIALNEIRRVVNAVIARHGPPAEIVVETLRDLGRSAKQRQEEDKKNRDNQKANNARRKLITELGLKVTGDNLTRLRLLDEQATDPKNRCCPYTGTIITPASALSDKVQIDHILPFALTLDDSMANRMLITREANQAKGKRTPFEAFRHTPEWPDIMARVALLPKQKKWRFEEDAAQKFADKGDFLARHMTDSATIARWAVFYLQVLAPEKVWSVPGRLTGLLRYQLGLNSQTVLGKGGARKERTDHRHHAIDAVVVALTDRSMLQRVSRAAKRGEAEDRLLSMLEEPWPGFVAEVAAKAQKIIVSHKPDKGTQGPLHDDTAYGPVKNPGDGPNVVFRKPIEALVEEKPEKIKSMVRDPQIANLIVDAAQQGGKAALGMLKGPNGTPVRSIRIWRIERNIQPIKDRKTGATYKFLMRNGNHRAEFWRLPTGKYKLNVVSRFEATQELIAIKNGNKPPDLRPHPAAKLLMRLYINDMVAFGQGAQRRILRVVKMSNGQIVLAPPQEAGKLQNRHTDKLDSFNYIFGSAKSFVEHQARKLWVDPSGRLVDPGPVT